MAMRRLPRPGRDPSTPALRAGGRLVRLVDTDNSGITRGKATLSAEGVGAE
jgi:hypothetical protein